MATSPLQTLEGQQAVFLAQMVVILLSGLQSETSAAFGTVLVDHSNLVDAGVTIITILVFLAVVVA